MEGGRQTRRRAAGERHAAALEARHDVITRRSTVKGLVIDPSDHHVTHILLDEGRLWGEKTVAIPISAVKRLGEVIRVTLSQDEIRELPPVDVEHPSEWASEAS